MPFKKLLVNSSSFVVKKLVLTTYYLLLTTILTGCTVIGTAKPAALQVTTRPEASVFLDGKHLGKTPFFSDQLKAGEYTVKVSASEANYVDKVTLNAGTLTVLNRELNNNFLAQSGEILWLEPGRGILIVSMPAEADLTVDGRLIGKTPKRIDEIEQGEHKIMLSKDGYVEREFIIKTSNKYQLNADVTLASIVAKSASSQPTPAPEVKKVEILKTSLGFVRVRNEPDIKSGEIGQVKTGEQLELVQEIKDWVKIKFEGKLGWISSQYAKKL